MASKDEQADQYVIEINPVWQSFSSERLDGNRWEQRKDLRRHPLAQWLHAFYSTHEKPFRYKVETIKELCGSEVEELWKFRQVLRRALGTLARVTGWQCAIDEKDCVAVVKHGTGQIGTGMAGRAANGELSTDGRPL